MVNGRLAENLSRLMSELQRFCDLSGIIFQKDGDSERLGKRILLSHGTSISSFEAIAGADFELLSQAELQRRGLKKVDRVTTEVVLKTDDYIFTFASPFRYPSTSCGILISPEAELTNTSSVATPFDTGGVVGHLLPNATTEEQRDFIANRELDAPDYREYLAHIVGSLFAEPDHYLDEVGPQRDGPFPIKKSDSRSWTAEIRFQNFLLSKKHLAALFIPIALASSPRYLTIVRDLKNSGVDIEFLKAPHWTELRQRSVDYFRGTLK